MGLLKFSVIAIYFLALAVYGQGLSTTDILKSIRDCKAENNCGENILQSLRKHEIPQTNEGLNAMYCTGQKIGMITADDKINGEILTIVLGKMRIDTAKAASIATTCQSQLAGSTHAEAARSLLICIQNNSN